MGRIAIAVASVVLALVGVELGLRAVGWSHRLATSSNVWARWIVYDPILVRRNEPGYVDEKLVIRVNALGLRGDEIATPKPPGTIRVVCLGDSTTFGVFERYEQNIRRLVAEAHAIGTRILFLDFPYRAIERGLSPGESFPNFFDDVQSLEELHAVHATYEAATIRIARDTGDEYLRTEDAIRAAPFPVFTDYDLSHLNDDGARLLGALVLNRLQELGWLGATTSATRSPATAAAPAAVPAAGSSGR
jgi:hypothetical protein